MTSRVLSRGHGAAGAVAYLTHDSPSADDPRPKTHGRVAGISFRGGLPPFDPTRDREEQIRLVSRVMQSTAADAKELKRLAGGSARGRPCTKPIETAGLSWPKNARPTWDQMETAGDSWIQAQGFQDHHFVMVAHVEDGVPYHLQLVGCMVSPIDGKAHTGNRALTGSRWAQKYEQEHGGIVIQTRVERNALRDELAATKESVREKAADEEDVIRSMIPAHEQDRLEAQLARIQAIEQKRIADARAAVRARMPASEPTRSCGGRSKLTPKESVDWAQTKDRQRQQRRELGRPTTRAGRRAHPEHQAALARAHRAESVRLARLQARRRALARTITAVRATVGALAEQLGGAIAAGASRVGAGVATTATTMGRALAVTGRAGRVLGRGLLGIARLPSRAVDLAMMVLPDDGGAERYDAAFRSVDRDRRRGMDLRAPPAPSSSGGERTGSSSSWTTRTPARPAQSRAAAPRSSRGTGRVPESAPPLAGANRGPEHTGRGPRR